MFQTGERLSAEWIECMEKCSRLVLCFVASIAADRTECVSEILNKMFVYPHAVCWSG